MRMFDPPHPGSVLKDYLGNVSVTAAAIQLGVTRATLSRILNGNAGISAEMALRCLMLSGPALSFGSGCRPSTICRKPRRKDIKNSSASSPHRKFSLLQPRLNFQRTKLATIHCYLFTERGVCGEILFHRSDKKSRIFHGLPPSGV